MPNIESHNENRRPILRTLSSRTADFVKQNVVEWVENIRQSPNLDLNTEDKLISLMSQLIEQKFRTFSYEALSQMLRLTPLSETISGQALLKDYSIETLLSQIRLKFSPSIHTMTAFSESLEALNFENLKTLLTEMVEIETVEQLEGWINDHLPAKEVA